MSNPYAPGTSVMHRATQERGHIGHSGFSFFEEKKEGDVNVIWDSGIHSFESTQNLHILGTESCKAWKLQPLLIFADGRNIPLLGDPKSSGFGKVFWHEGLFFVCEKDPFTTHMHLGCGNPRMKIVYPYSCAAFIPDALWGSFRSIAVASIEHSCFLHDGDEEGAPEGYNLVDGWFRSCPFLGIFLRDSHCSSEVKIHISDETVPPYLLKNLCLHLGIPTDSPFAEVGHANEFLQIAVDEELLHQRVINATPFLLP